MWVNGLDDGVIAYAPGSRFTEIAISDVDGGVVPAGIFAGVLQFCLRVDDPLLQQVGARCGE